MVLGVRGVPAAHGGFETFAENFSLYLREQGWQVTVFCQQHASWSVSEDEWRGVRRVNIGVPFDNALATIVFDLISVLLSLRRPGKLLVLGYNTAVFLLLYRLFSRQCVINMDGIEWKRDKWGLLAKTWFYINEYCGAWWGNGLVADHPEIKRHLERHTRGDKITVIPYGAEAIGQASEEPVRALGVEPRGYALLVARPEPENSILEIVRAFSAVPRQHKLVVLGNYQPANAYHQAVRAVASADVLFVGAIYDAAIVSALRFHCRFYVHGHQVGGTNPSLVEALSAGSAILAHDNRFNRWVAGAAGQYFSSEAECGARMDDLFSNDPLIAELQQAARQRHAEAFTLEKIHRAYEALLRLH